jgi:hypothetical protein
VRVSERGVALTFALVTALGASSVRADGGARAAPTGQVGPLAPPLQAPPPPPISDEAILGTPGALRLESILTRYTVFDQNGQGWQSRQSTATSPGSEALAVYEPQIVAVFRQGDAWRHQVSIPVDLVTAASPVVPGPRPDVISAASETNQAGAVDEVSTYKSSPETTLSVHSNVHIERMFRSWGVGGGWARSFLDGDATVGLTLNQVNDWFDAYNVFGTRYGHQNRSTSNGNLAFTRVLSPTTIGEVNYGFTLQTGELGNTWSSVPLVGGGRTTETFPDLRERHALVGRLAQYLPWSGALHLFARGYADDWGIYAITGEVELMQRLTPWFYLQGSYRVHRQTGVSFFTTLLRDPTATPATADSDLQELTAQSVGMKLAADIPLARGLFDARSTHFDIGLTRYFRDNDLTVWVFTCASGLNF